MTQTILIILSHMIAFSIGQLPVIMLAFYKRLNLGLRYDYQSMLRVIPLSVILIIVSVYKIVVISVYNSDYTMSMNTNVSLFFAITFIACVFLSLYFIIDRAIFHFKSKPRKLVLNIAAGITILLAIFAFFQLISLSQKSDTNYIDLAINYIYPIITGVLAIAGIISLIFYKRLSRTQKIYSFIFLFSLPLVILDIFFAEKFHILLSCIPYIIYVIIVFIEVFSSATKETSTSKDKKTFFKKRYELTDREFEVYALAAKGLPNQEISEKLFVSVHTIKSHLQHIFSKLNISTRYQLINYEKEHKKDNK